MKTLIELISRSSLTLTAKGLHVKGALAFLIAFMALLFVTFALFFLMFNDAESKNVLSLDGMESLLLTATEEVIRVQRSFVR